MSIAELTSRDAVEQAMYEAVMQGRTEFLNRYAFEQSERYHVIGEDGRLHDPEAIAAVAVAKEHPGRAPLQFASRDEREAAHKALESLGFEIVDAQPEDIEGERTWRRALWAHLATMGDLDSMLPNALRAYGAYGGQQGIWVDKKRTGALASDGLTMSVLHTGRHYPDEFDTTSAIYHYPTTRRLRGRDDSEIRATKAAAEHNLPIIVITKVPLERRAVRLAWVESWDDASRTFLLDFEEVPDRVVHATDESDAHPFELCGSTTRRASRTVRIRPGQPRFKMAVFQRYGPRCPLSGINVPEMIDAAHLRPVADDGTDDPRNGLPLNAALHRAFDAGLFAIDPDSLEVRVRQQGPSLAELGIVHSDLHGLAKKPHPQALKWRFDNWTRDHNQ